MSDSVQLPTDKIDASVAAIQKFEKKYSDPTSGRVYLVLKKGQLTCKEEWKVVTFFSWLFRGCKPEKAPDRFSNEAITFYNNNKTKIEGKLPEGTCQTTRKLLNEKVQAIATKVVSGASSAKTTQQEQQQLVQRLQQIKVYLKEIPRTSQPVLFETFNPKQRFFISLAKDDEAIWIQWSGSRLQIKMTDNGVATVSFQGKVHKGISILKGSEYQNILSAAHQALRDERETLTGESSQAPTPTQVPTSSAQAAQQAVQPSQPTVTTTTTTTSPASVQQSQPSQPTVTTTSPSKVSLSTLPKDEATELKELFQKWDSASDDEVYAKVQKYGADAFKEMFDKFQNEGRTHRFRTQALFNRLFSFQREKTAKFLMENLSPDKINISDFNEFLGNAINNNAFVVCVALFKRFPEKIAFFPWNQRQKLIDQTPDKDKEFINEICSLKNKKQVESLLDKINSIITSNLSQEEIWQLKDAIEGLPILELGPNDASLIPKISEMTDKLLERLDFRDASHVDVSRTLSGKIPSDLQTSIMEKLITTKKYTSANKLILCYKWKRPESPTVRLMRQWKKERKDFLNGALACIDKNIAEKERSIAKSEIIRNLPKDIVE